MGLTHIAVMRTDLGLGALVHRRCLDACHAPEIEAGLTDEDIRLAGITAGCLLCDEPLELQGEPTDHGAVSNSAWQERQLQTIPG